MRPPAQDVQVVANGISLYLKTEISGQAVESATVHVTGDQTAVVTVQPASPVNVPDGTSTASVSIIGCTDPVCSGRVAGNPQEVAVTYTKSIGGLTGMPSALTFTQTPGQPPPADQTVSLRDLGDGSFPWSSNILYQNGSGWLAVTPSSGNTLPATATIGIVPGVAMGSTSATVQFIVGTTSSFSVAVAYMVNADFQVMPTAMTVTGAFGMTTPPQHLSLSDSLGGSYPWTVAIEYDPNDIRDWATASATSGSTLPADVVISLGALPDRLSHFAALRVKAAQFEQLIPLSYRTP